MSAVATEPLYPPTGEPASVNARRNRLGLWMCIASDITGSVALWISYLYLWSLNVNNGWAPPKNSFAPAWPFWAIFGGALVSTVLIWAAYKRLAAGHRGAFLGLATLGSLLILATFVADIVQLSTFPFGPGDGAYASVTFWMVLVVAFHLSLLSFLTLGITLRTRAGRITPENPSHARFVALYMTWVTVSILIGAILTTALTTSSGTGGPAFGTFTSQGS